MTQTRGAEDINSFLRSLRAVRSFRPDPVPREVVDDALNVARWSGSASNRQPWEIIVIRDRETLEALAVRRGLRETPGRGTARDRAGHGRGSRRAGGLR